MKNKITFLILMLIATFSLTTKGDCASVLDNIYTDESYVETQDSDCEIIDAYKYVSVGVGPIIFVPNVGIGYRERYSQLGWDTALSFSTIGYAHQLSAHLVGHYYLNPFKQNSPYFGFGLMGSGICTNRGKGGVSLSPDFVFGKELERSDDTRHFVEMHVAFPSVWMNSKHVHSLYFPFLYIKYGISF